MIIFFHKHLLESIISINALYRNYQIAIIEAFPDFRKIIIVLT